MGHPTTNRRGRALSMGFGWSFYGFFVAAGAWLIVYFTWAWLAAQRDRARDGDGR